MSAKARVDNLLPFLALWALCPGEDFTDIEIVPLPDRGADRAYETCPCINVSAAEHGNFSALGSNIPHTYGSSCKAWDADGAGWYQCRVAKPPHYCSVKWCYVDDKNCSLPYSDSVAYEGVHYTWSGCGSLDFLDRASDLDASRSFKNGLIKTGLKVTANSSTVESAVLRYARELLEDVGINPDFQVVHQQLSMDAREAMGTNSIYTMCVYDLALGLLDFCLYDFWLTHTRINTGAIPVSFSSDTFHLFIPAVEEKGSFLEELAKPFRPFSWGLWGLCVAVVGAYGLLLGFFQAGHDVKDAHKCSTRTLWHILEHTYSAFLGWFSQGVLEDPRELKLASKILTMGFAFFILIVIASFTGSTAAYLTMQRSKLPLSDVDDAVSRNIKICYPVEIRDALVLKFPGLLKLGVPFPWSSERTIFDEVRDGKCTVAVASYQYSINSESVCGFMPAGPAVHSVPLGYFVSRELGQKFLYHDSKLHQAGVWGQFEHEVNRAYPCPKAERKDAELVQLDVTHMFGNCMVLVASGILGLVVNCLRKSGSAAIESSEVLQRATSPKSCPRPAPPAPSADDGDPGCEEGGQPSDRQLEGSKEELRSHGMSLTPQVLDSLQEQLERALADVAELTLELAEHRAPKDGALAPSSRAGVGETPARCRESEAASTTPAQKPSALDPSPTRDAELGVDGGSAGSPPSTLTGAAIAELEFRLEKFLREYSDFKTATEVRFEGLKSTLHLRSKGMEGHVGSRTQSSDWMGDRGCAAIIPPHASSECAKVLELEQFQRTGRSSRHGLVPDCAALRSGAETDDVRAGAGGGDVKLVPRERREHAVIAYDSYDWNGRVYV